MPLNRRYQDIAELPACIPLFPLEGALLLPHAAAPLNVFEPRYLKLVDDALAGDRLIGIIQPLPAISAQPQGDPALFDIGCLGRITELAETGDGRYHLGLHGVCRFKLKGETPSAPYRTGIVEYKAFTDDLNIPNDGASVNRADLLEALRKYADRHGYSVDWDNIERAPTFALVDALSVAGPFGSREKQALLEASSVSERAAVLIALAEIDLAGPGSRALQ